MKAETLGGCLLLAVFTLLWLGWVCVTVVGLLLETDGMGSWNVWTWLLLLATFVVAPALLWLGFVAVIRLDDSA
jgi:hypothetical protein